MSTLFWLLIELPYGLEWDEHEACAGSHHEGASKTEDCKKIHFLFSLLYFRAYIVDEISTKVYSFTFTLSLE